MRAFSVRQPWAWLIVRGIKDIENRTWRTNYRGEVLIHAGKRMDREGLAWARAMAYFPGIEFPRVFPLGGIVGAAEIVDCVSASKSSWFEGPWGFVMRGAREVEFRECPGRLGIWEMGDMGSMRIMKGR